MGILEENGVKNLCGLGVYLGGIRILGCKKRAQNKGSIFLNHKLKNMNIKRVIIGVIFGGSLFLCSCSAEEEQKESMKTQKGNIEGVKPKLNHPAIFFGTSFGEFFQMLHKTGEYHQMLTYTSQSTRQKFEEKELLNFYQEMNFSYTLKLKAFKDSVLLYIGTIDATIRTIQVNVAVEDDTCRIVFDKLTPEKPFTGL